MTSEKKNKLTETTERVGKALARSSFKAETVGRRAQKRVEDLVGKVSRRGHRTMAETDKPAAAEKLPEATKATPPFTAGPGLSIPEQFGFIAGAIHTYLDKNGHVPTSRLINALMRQKNSRANVLAAIGWLAREDKLQFSEDGAMVALK